MLDAEQTAAGLYIWLKRTGKSRARISDKKLRTFSGRRTGPRVEFVNKLQAECEDLGVALFRLERGGFGLVTHKSVEGAPSLKFNEAFSAAERSEISQGGSFTDWDEYTEDFEEVIDLED